MTADRPTADTPIVQLVEWRTHADALIAVRTEVFVVEQQVSPELEIDGLDPDCIHAAAMAGSRVIGTARLLPEARIGRMAVLGAWRGRGVGARILDMLLAAAHDRGDAEVRLAAQVGAMGFYARHGFVAAGEEFLEAGLRHRHMILKLDDDPAPARDG